MANSLRTPARWLGALLGIKRVGFAVREFFSRVWKRIHG
jgi:hypothetical protein